MMKVTMMKRSPNPKTKAVKSQPGEDPPGLVLWWLFLIGFLERGKEGGGETGARTCRCPHLCFLGCCLSVP